MKKKSISLFLSSFLALFFYLSSPASAGASGSVFPTPTDEQWAASLLFQSPGVGDFDVYSQGIGLEAQYRRWFGFGGLALSLGAEQWNTENQSSNWGADEPSRLSGEVTLLPVGASAIGRWPIREGLLLRGEAGLRYVWTDSKIRVRMPGATASESVDIDDGWIALAGLGIEQLVTESVMIFGGIRYQDDLVRADATTENESLMDNHLRAFSVQLGVQLWY